MRNFVARQFDRIAHREGIDDERLLDAAERAARGLVDADLGSGLIKQRVARAGRGRSGEYRTLMAFRTSSRTVFVYAFAKNERDNIKPDELNF